MFPRLADSIIDRVVRAYRPVDNPNLVPRWCLRWSISLTVLALVEFLIGAVAAVCRGQYVEGAVIASLGAGWLLVYAVSLGLCYILVYQSQTRLFQRICQRPFWRPLARLQWFMPVLLILLVSVVGNFAGIQALVFGITGVLVE